MNNITSIPIFCITCNDTTGNKYAERQQRMRSRFQNLGLDFEFVFSPDSNDPAIYPGEELIQQGMSNDRWKPYIWSGSHGHFNAIKQFLDTGKQIGIICEDDIMLHKDLKEELPVIVANFNRQKLDLLLMSYLTPLTDLEKPAVLHCNKPLKSPFFSYHSYDNEHELWGAQMYMIERNNAERLYDKYGPHTDYKFRSLKQPDIPVWVADWVITKEGNRALINPMMAVEEGVPTQPPHLPLHARNLEFNYDNNIYF